MVEVLTTAPAPTAPGALGVTAAEGRTTAEPAPVIGMDARIAFPSMRTGGAAPSGMTRACRPIKREVVEETVFEAIVMFRPEPGAVPKSRIGATQGSDSVPVPVTVRVLEPSNPTKWPSQGTMGG